MQDKITFILGTRPEIIKIAPLAKKLNSEFIFTGQHFNKNMSDDFFHLLDSENIVNLKLSKEKRSSVKTMSYEISLILQKSESKKIVVQGDTNSTLAGAIAAKFTNKKLFYLESGMRSGDLMQVEEFNRILISHLSDMNFCNHKTNRENLIKENIPKEKIFLSGSTVFSSLLLINHEDIKNGYENYILLTLHRPENVDKKNKLFDILCSIDELNEKVIFPIHPRTKDKIDLSIFTNITFIEPQNYISFIELMKNSKFIISDSGGVQEEAAILRKPLLIPRRHTERPEMLGVFNLLTEDTKDLFTQSQKILNTTSDLVTKVMTSKLLYGKEEVIDKIRDVILK